VRLDQLVLTQLAQLKHEVQLASDATDDGCDKLSM
jgi:hypothetical protein